MIEYIQNSFSPPVIGWIGPIIFIGILMLFFGRWLTNKAGLFAFIYVFSIVTGIIIDVTRDVSNVQGATIAGVYAPISYFFLFASVLLFRNLYISTQTNPDPAFLRVEKLTVGILGTLVAGFLGAVIGLIAGAIFSFTGLTYLAIRLLPVILVYELDPDSVFSTAVVDTSFDIGVYAFAVMGLLFGLAYGVTRLKAEQSPSHAD